MDLKISNHARERYAERAKDRAGALSVNAYVASNAERIDREVNELASRADVVFKGAQPGRSGVVEIRMAGTWVVIIAPDERKVITLYPIDLGMGADLDKQYAGRAKALLAEEKEKLEAAEAELEARKKDYLAIIADNEAMCKEYRGIIRSLEEQNEGYRQAIDGMAAEKRAAEEGMRAIIRRLTGSNKF